MRVAELRTKIVRSDSCDPWFNLALEEYLMQNVLDHEVILYLWQNDRTVVIGRNQNAWKECAWEQLEKNGGKLARRLSGGGAVYHDLGNLNFTFLMRKRHYDLKKQLTVILDSLKKFDIDAQISGRNDLLIGDRKFSGHAFCFRGQAAYHHGTILINSDVDKMADYLRPSKSKIASKGVDSVRSRVVNLVELNPSLSIPAVMDSLAESFGIVYGRPREHLTFDENKIDLSSAYQKYSSWEWRFGESPQFDISFSERFSWGEIEIGLRLKKGRVESCTVFSDAMDEKLIRRIPPVLQGVPFSPESISQAIQTLHSHHKEGNEIIDDIFQWIKGAVL
ncbi:MAG: lipoate--protein ligase [Bacillota bacterium]